MKTSLYIGPRLAALLDSRTGNGETRQRSGIINTVADRYLEVVRRYRPDLSPAQWLLCCDALNGVWVQEPASLAIGGVPLSVRDAIDLDGAAERWQVDGPALVERLDSLGFAGLLAIVDVVERFWAQGTDGTAEERLAEVLA